MLSKLVIIAGLLMFANSAQCEEWYAMARHGECIRLDKINDRDKHVKGASTPEEMENKFKETGIKYTIKPILKGQTDMLELSVPSKNWAMVLVTRLYCKNFIEK